MEAFIKYLILPSNLIALSAVLGFGLLCSRWSRRVGVWLSLWTFVCYAVFASGPVAFLLLGYLEYQVPSATASERENIHTIVVLSAYAESDPSVPLSSRVSSGTAFRLLEAISLFQVAPDSNVIVSGGGVVPGIMRDVLISAGIPSDHIAVDDKSLSTFESATHLAPILGMAPFLLVTSAGHMPRAKGVFQKLGTNPRAVSTHYMSKKNWLAIQYLPSPAHLAYSDLAVSEYAALLWYWLDGRI